MTDMELRARVEREKEWIIEMRRKLHRIPEKGFAEFKTQKAVMDALDEMGVKYTTERTWVIGLIEGELPGDTVGIRADMDALPVTEPEGCPFRSEHEGMMHACGHDAHTAMLLGAAKTLMCLRHEIEGTVYLCFERGEEHTGNIRYIIAYIEKLIELDSVCTEGVINYIYWYYKGENNDAMCQKILYEFMKPHDQALNNFNRRQLERGLNSWGLKVIFEGAADLKDYEKGYLKFIIYENPGEELLRLFAFLVHQEEIRGRYNLKLYFDILFQIHCREKFCNILINSVSSWGNTGINLSELIEYDIKLSKINPEGAKRFRWYLFLILKCLRWQAKEELEKYWVENCNETEILQKLDGEIWFEKQEES